MGPVVAVVVVVACIGVVGWLTLGGEHAEPATSRPRRARAARGGSLVPPEHRPSYVTPAPDPGHRRPRGGELVGPEPWWVRLRAATILGAMSAVLGLVAAALVGMTLVVLFALLQSGIG